MNLDKLFPRNKKAAKVFESHQEFINKVIAYLSKEGYSIHDSQIVAQIAELASRGETFSPLLKAAQDAVTTLLQAHLHPIDALLSAQMMALIMKNENPQRIVDGAEAIATMYADTGLQQNLFSTDMANMGRKLSEAFNKMGLGEVKIEEV